MPPSVPPSAETDRRAQRFYHPELDVLRFFAFMAVLVYHSYWPTLSEYLGRGVPRERALWMVALQKAGAFGVDLFFILSAYLITELLLREYAKRGKLDVKAFYIRRALRIWPLYYAFLLADFFIIPHIIKFEQMRQHGGVWYLTFLGNWYTVRHGFPPTVGGQLWTVCLEEQFYITWPLLLLVLKPRAIKGIAVAMIAVAFITRILLVRMHAGESAFWCNTLARLDPLAAGALLAVALRGGAPAWGRGTRWAMAAAGALCWVLTRRYLGIEGPLALAGYPVVTVGALLLLLAALRPAEDAPWWVRSRTLIYLGRISYGLYVFHAIFVWIFWRLGFTVWAAIPLSLAGSIFTAALSYRLLEDPFLRLKERFTYVASRPVEATAETPAPR